MSANSPSPRRVRRGARDRASGFAVASGEGKSAARAKITRGHVQMAAVLFVGGGLGAIPADVLHRPAYPGTIYLLPSLAIISGLICWLLADRLGWRALHVIGVIATAEIALTVGFAGPVFSVYFIFVAIFAAYVFRDRRAIAAHVLLTVTAAFAPVVYEPELAREHLVRWVVLAPSLILTSGSVAFLRERLAASERRYRLLSERDPLTGVGNYRMLTERVPAEIERHRRGGRPLAVLSIDLDGFKAVNDNLGHQRGDRVLQEVGVALATTVRAGDYVVRQGGDEFAVVAVDTDRTKAFELSQRLSSAIESITVEGLPIRASIGMAVFPADGDGLEKLLATADLGLREVKSGKPEHRPRTMSLFAAEG